MSEAPKETTSQWAIRYLNMAKEKTQETFSIVKKDLGVVKEVATQGASKLSSVAHQGINAAQQGINTAVKTVSNKISDDQKTWMASTASKVGAVVQSFSFATNRDDDAYTEVIRYQRDFLDEDSKEFHEWKKTFQLTDYIAEVNKIVVREPEVRKKYIDLVETSQMTKNDFWAKFFYYMQFKVVKDQPRADDDDDFEFTTEIDLNSEKEKPEQPDETVDDGEEKNTDDIIRLDDTDIRKSNEREVDDGWITWED